MKTAIVTDLDYMVGLGHSEKDVREALKITKGNRNAALYILVKGSTKSDLAWRNDNPDDWVHGVDTLPNIAENRALYISPVYIYAESYYPTDDLTDYKYKLKISMKDGRHWKIAKTYSEFRNFKSSLPFGTTFMFTNSFPMPILGYGEQSKSFLDGRLATLAEWIRELVMNEKCMTSERVLDALYNFIEVDSNGGKPGKPSQTATACATTPVRPTSIATSPLMNNAIDSINQAATKRKHAFYSSVQLLEIDFLPLSLQLASEMLPFKVDVRTLSSYIDLLNMKAIDIAKKDDTSLSSIYHDIDLIQLEKDCRRDRLIVQGQRIEGSQTKIDAVFSCCSHAIYEVITKSGRIIEPSTPKHLQSRLSSPKAVGLSPADSAKNTSAAAGSATGSATTTTATPDELPRATLASSTSVDEPSPETTTCCHPIQNSALGTEQPADSSVPSAVPPPIDPLSDSADTLLIPPPPAAAATTTEYSPPSPTICQPPECPSSSTNPFDGPGEECTDTSLPITAVSSTMEESCNQLSKIMLHLISRTESAYISHASLSEILDTLNKHEVEDFQPFLFVPESSLAEPLRLNFSVFERNGGAHISSRFTKPSHSSNCNSSDWCLECTGETSTVYRIYDAMTLKPIIQLRVTFLITIYGMPTLCNNNSTAAAAVVKELTLKEGKCQLIFEKATATTSRDWNKDREN